MIEAFIQKVVTVFISSVVAIAGIVGGVFSSPNPSEDPNLGVALPSATALFETSLAAPITASTTSMTLTANSVRGGTSLSGYQCFTIDEGSAQSEFVCGTVSGTSVTSMERGLSPADGTTETSSLKFSHRRGASVKITDFPLLQRITQQNTGSGTFESAIKYAESVSTSTLSSDGQNLASVAYANSLSFGAVAQANEATGGFVELATGSEAASSTSSGSVARLVLPASIATSSPSTTGNFVVVTNNTGKIDSSFFTASVIRTYTATGTTTWTKPSGLKFIRVQVWGGGGSGAHMTGGGNETGGGGGGGYSERLLDASQVTTTISVTVGGGGVSVSGCGGAGCNGNTGSTSNFGTYVIAYGGGAGAFGASGATGGGGGGQFGAGSVSGTAGDILASAGSSTATPTPAFSGGGGGGAANAGAAVGGGSTIWGGAGGGGIGSTYSNGGTSVYGGNGGAAGDGGTDGTSPGGGGGSSNGATGSGDGGSGRVIVTEYYY